MTRYLCAAAHLDASFADQVIAEYLVEPARAVPPSPGVDAGAVLREALAARSRRKTRDAVLLLLLLVMAVFSFLWLLIWALIGFGVAFLSALLPDRVRGLLAGVGVLAGLALALGNWRYLGTSLTFVAFLFSGRADPQVGAIVGLIASVAIAAIVAADEGAVWHVTRAQFRHSMFLADARRAPKGWVRQFRTFGHANHQRELDRAAAADARSRVPDGSAGVTVHRGRVPFVGAGNVVLNEVLALPLVPDDDATEKPEPFTAAELQAHVAEVLGKLRSSGSLSPGGRLASLQITEEVFVPAEQLLRRTGTSLGPTILPNDRRPPVRHIPLETARDLADRPQEAARYYRCYRVESWDRELTTSSYFTAGTDSRTLYVEWTHCVLPPLREQFRSIDRHTDNGPFTTFLETLNALPLTVPVRVVGVFRTLEPLPHDPDAIEPARYGAGRSLRELAAAQRPGVFFQEADAVRYMTILEQAFFAAVQSFLESRHYSVDDVLGAAKAKISNSITIQNGTFHNSAIGIGSVRQERKGPTITLPGRKEES
ncbi:hypothetical protein [Pseudonocardia ailaonensis]|uniref:hypothetical protein n=1 Tax=Pseudonocardia ailaonensis TaxID=367279 RepID=UPI0031D9602F